MYTDSEKYLPDMPSAVEIPLTPALIKSASIMLVEPGLPRDDYIFVKGRSEWLKFNGFVSPSDLQNPDVKATYNL